jgi:hypothetical protein
VQCVVEETNEKCIPLIADLLFGFWRKGGECVIGNKGLFSLHYILPWSR